MKATWEAGKLLQRLLSEFIPEFAMSPFLENLMQFTSISDVTKVAVFSQTCESTSYVDIDEAKFLNTVHV